MPYSLTCKKNIYAYFIIFNLAPRRQNKCILSVVRISMLNVTGGFSVVAVHYFHSLPYNRSAVSKASSPPARHSVFFNLQYPLRTTVSGVIMQQVVAILYRRFGTSYRSHLHGSRIIA
jgi:hypothetical protein